MSQQPAQLLTPLPPQLSLSQVTAAPASQFLRPDTQRLSRCTPFLCTPHSVRQETHTLSSMTYQNPLPTSVASAPVRAAIPSPLAPALASAWAPPSVPFPGPVSVQHRPGHIMALLTSPQQSPRVRVKGPFWTPGLHLSPIISLASQALGPTARASLISYGELPPLTSAPAAPPAWSSLRLNAGVTSLPSAQLRTQASPSQACPGHALWNCGPYPHAVTALLVWGGSFGPTALVV